MIFEYAFKNEFISSNKVKFIELVKKEVVINRKYLLKKKLIFYGKILILTLIMANI